MTENITLQEVQGLFTAVAPIVGTPRVLAGAAAATSAIGSDLAVAEPEIATMHAVAEAESAERSQRAAS